MCIFPGESVVQLFRFSLKIVCARETRERSDASDLNGIVRSHRIASCAQFTRAGDLWREKGDCKQVSMRCQYYFANCEIV